MPKKSTQFQPTNSLFMTGSIHNSIVDSTAPISGWRFRIELTRIQSSKKKNRIRSSIKTAGPANPYKTINKSASHLDRRSDLGQLHPELLSYLIEVPWSRFKQEKYDLKLKENTRETTWILFLPIKSEAYCCSRQIYFMINYFTHRI